MWLYFPAEKMYLKRHFSKLLFFLWTNFGLENYSFGLCILIFGKKFKQKRYYREVIIQLFDNCVRKNNEYSNKMSYFLVISKKKMYLKFLNIHRMYVLLLCYTYAMKFLQLLWSFIFQIVLWLGRMIDVFHTLKSNLKKK